jgi:ADP-heptose:LPS heptosyltransferase
MLNGQEPRPTFGPTPSPSVKILVLRFSSIGDIVLTSPVLRGLAQQVKGAEVHVATKEGFMDLVRHNPHVSKVHALGDDLGDLIGRLKPSASTRWSTCTTTCVQPG